jgi:hypothetical protein
MNINLLPMEIAYEAEAGLKSDLMLHGSGWLRLTADGDRLRVEHVPWKDVQVQPAQETSAGIHESNWLTDPISWDMCDRHETTFPMGERCPRCSSPACTCPALRVLDHFEGCPALETSPIRTDCDSCGATDGLHSEECENMKCDICQLRHGVGESCIVQPAQETSAARCNHFPGQTNCEWCKQETPAAPEKPLFQARFCEYKGELVQRSDGVMVCPQCGNQS